MLLHQPLTTIHDFVLFKGTKEAQYHIARYYVEQRVVFLRIKPPTTSFSLGTSPLSFNSLGSSWTIFDLGQQKPKTDYY